MHCGLAGILMAGICLGATSTSAQLQLGTPSQPTSALTDHLTDPGYDASIQPLLEADRRFAAETKAGGGLAFMSWFADDAVTLSNGKPAVQGKQAIARGSDWDAKDYQLLWSPDGARIGPSHDSGVTWGSYEGHARDHQGNAVVTSGRYITVWKKDTAGKWKVVLDASNQAPPESNACCSIH
jgi:ketosteroid isomerase-like protein